MSGVGRETHATAGQEASATNSLTRLLKSAAYSDASTTKQTCALAFGSRRTISTDGK